MATAIKNFIANRLYFTSKKNCFLFFFSFRFSSTRLETKKPAMENLVGIQESSIEII